MSGLLQAWSPMFRRTQIRRLSIIVVLLAIALTSAIPNYFSGQWAWTQTPKVEVIQELKDLQDTGLSLPNWQTLDQQTGQIGGHKWSIQQMQAKSPSGASEQPTEFVLLLLPQDWHDKQPQVEWMDLNGFLGRMARPDGSPLGWTTDTQRRLTFTVSPSQGAQGPVTVNARFLRGWNQGQTYAMLQWYAWPNGGNASSSRWFWIDQWSQFRDQHRTPWVAVSVLIPMKPLGDITVHQALATSIGQEVQSALEVVFQSKSSAS